MGNPAVNYRWDTRARYYRAHADHLDFLDQLKINSPTNQAPSEGSETLADKYSTRQIQIYRAFFCWDLVFTCFKNEKPKMDHTKIGTADLDSSCRELSNGGLGIVIALLVRRGINFVCAYIGRAIQL